MKTDADMFIKADFIVKTDDDMFIDIYLGWYLLY